MIKGNRYAFEHAMFLSLGTCLVTTLGVMIYYDIGTGRGKNVFSEIQIGTPSAAAASHASAGGWKNYYKRQFEEIRRAMPATKDRPAGPFWKSPEELEEEQREEQQRLQQQAIERQEATRRAAKVAKLEQEEDDNDRVAKLLLQHHMPAKSTTNTNQKETKAAAAADEEIVEEQQQPSKKTTTNGFFNWFTRK